MKDAVDQFIKCASREDWIRLFDTGMYTDIVCGYAELACFQCGIVRKKRKQFVKELSELMTNYGANAAITAHLNINDSKYMRKETGTTV